MEWIRELITELLLALLSGSITYIAAKLGAVIGTFFKRKLEDDTLGYIAKTCVFAVEQMYRENSGEEKLSEALSLASEMLEEKGIRVEAGKMRVLLEAALAEWKGAWERA